MSDIRDIREFRLTAADFHPTGHGLSRPECIIAERDGTLWISDDQSALLRIGADGGQTRVGTMRGLPNGIAMGRDGALYIANIGDGRLYRQHRDGRHEVILEHFDGHPLGSTNFVYVDDRDRMWVTVSTVTEPRSEAVQRLIPDGYLLRNDGDGWKRVGGGYHFTNEVRVDAAGEYVYVAETSAGRVSRHRLLPDGSLGPRENYGPDPLFPGCKIDGFAFDAAGNLWITEVRQNGLIVVTPDQHSHIVIMDPDARILHSPASITFGGPDLRTAYVGSLKMDTLPTFRAPFPGLPMVHWGR